MIYFDCDYMAGAHPEVMARLAETNLLHTAGYGGDPFTAEAEEKILKACRLDGGKVFFMEGGTQTNLLVITRLLGYSDGVIATDTAHIAVHEAGAIEAAGHKVITLPGHDGKLRASDIEEYLDAYGHDDTREHIVRPAMVYITFPTELGTVYTRYELTAIRDVCRRHEVPLYIDGARLAYGLAADGNDLTLPDIASLCDAFYIGGTKCGALFGEAIVTSRPELFPRFFSLCKQRGAVLAKGRLLGLQFSTLFTDGLYERIGRHAVELAMLLKEGMIAKGHKLFIDSPTNQQFFILPNSTIEELRKIASFELWGPIRENETPVRFVTDWSTAREDVERFLSAM